MMLTRCPACQTVFRLHQAQLRARNGEVRCGHCFNPFNALQHRVATPSDEGDNDNDQLGALTRQAAAGGESAAADTAGRREAARAGSVDTLDFELPDFPPFDSDEEAAGAEPAVSSMPDAAPREAETARTYLAPAETPPPRPARPQSEEVPFADDIDATAPPEVVRNVRRTYPDTDHPETGPSEPETTAMPVTAPETKVAATDDAVPATSAVEPETEPRSADRPEARHVDLEHLDATYGRPRRRSSPLVRTLGGMAVGLLAGTLAAQSLYLFRVEISRELPGLRPLLQAGCAKLGCEVPLPRDIALIGIETSDLQSEPGRPGRYLLHSSVKNRADYPQAWPHLELTLTDATDTPVARRVLAPKEWVPEARLAESLAAKAVIPVRLPFDLQGASPTGYRVYVFYP